MVKGVIFDLDGTLYDYETCNAIAEKELKTAVQEHLRMDAATFWSILEKAKTDVKGRLGNTAASHNRLLYMQRLCEMAGVSPFGHAIALYNVYWDCMLDQMALFPYVKELFLRLHQKEIQIALLTDLTAQIQYRKIEKLVIGKDISCIVTSEEAGAEKPDAVMFSMVLEKLGLSAEETIMVGDSQKRDIEGAACAGIQGVLYEGQENFTEIVMGFIEGRPE